MVAEVEAKKLAVEARKAEAAARKAGKGVSEGQSVG